jgi:hypothetical protein
MTFGTHSSHAPPYVQPFLDMLESKCGSQVSLKHGSHVFCPCQELLYNVAAKRHITDHDIVPTTAIREDPSWAARANTMI